jgi:hypothetical protein
VPQGVVPQLESFGHFLLWSALDEHGAQRLVTTVIRVPRMKEKLATAHIVHDQPSLEIPVASLATNAGDGTFHRSGNRRKFLRRHARTGNVAVSAVAI